MVLDLSGLLTCGVLFVANSCRKRAGMRYAYFLLIDRFPDIQFSLNHQTWSSEAVNPLQPSQKGLHEIVSI